MMQSESQVKIFMKNLMELIFAVGGINEKKILELVKLLVYL
jgi:hypothetical protein